MRVKKRERVRVPGLLVKRAADVTEDHVKKLGEIIERGCSPEVAAPAAGFSVSILRKIMHDDAEPLCELMRDTIEVSGAKFERTCLEKWRSNPMESRSMKEMLEFVRPKLTERSRIQVQYELALLLEIVSKHVDADTLTSIVTAIAEIVDTQPYIDKFDARLMGFVEDVRAEGREKK